MQGLVKPGRYPGCVELASYYRPLVSVIVGLVLYILSQERPMQQV